MFATGPLAGAEPELKVRRASRKPNRLGFAVPDQFRISVTAYPGIRQGDLLETLLHELVHLHVGRQPGGHAWHGRVFKQTLRQAMQRGLRHRRPAAAQHPARGLRGRDRGAARQPRVGSCVCFRRRKRSPPWPTRDSADPR